MTGDLLWRGMLAGLLAAFLSALFALAFVEPHVDRAIAFEHASDHRHATAGVVAGEAPLVPRATQKTAGLFTAMMLYGAAIGGLFALVFAVLHGRVGLAKPRALALLLAGVGFVVVVLVPAIKYPPTPPAVGLHETVRLRTGAFFTMIALSLIACGAAVQLSRQLRGRVDAITAMLLSAGFYVVLVAVLGRMLPTIDEVPADFPATLLWQFRVTSLGAQALLWIVLGIVFGDLAERKLRTPAR